MNITYTYQSVVYNNVKGYFATRRVNGLYDGMQFGKTKKQARQAFDQEFDADELRNLSRAVQSPSTYFY